MTLLQLGFYQPDIGWKKSKGPVFDYHFCFATSLYVKLCDTCRPRDRRLTKRQRTELKRIAERPDIVVVEEGIQAKECFVCFRGKTSTEFVSINPGTLFQRVRSKLMKARFFR